MKKKGSVNKRKSNKTIGDMPRLLKALRETEGFSLHFVVYDSKSIAKKIPKELTDRLDKPLKTVEIGKSSDPVSGLLKKVALSIQDEIIYITGIYQAVFPSDSKFNYDVLDELNARLFELRNLNRTLLIVLPVNFVEIFRTTAPDFWEWRHGFYIFEACDEDRYRICCYLTDHFFGSTSYDYHDQKLERLTLYQALQLDYDDDNLDDRLLLQYELTGKLGRLHFKLGDYPKAREFLDQQMALVKMIRGFKLFPEVLNNIGMICLSRCEYREALDYFQRAWEAAKRSLRGANHPGKAIILSNMGEVYAARNNRQEAFLKCRQALRMCEKRLGMRHPLLVPVLIKFSEVLCSQKDYETALDHYRRALHIVEKTWDMDHPYMGVVLQHIGIAYYDQKKYERARRYLYRTVESTEKAVGPEHPYLGMLFNIVGLSHFHRENHEWAMRYFNWALEIRKKSVGPEDLVLGKIYSNIARVYHLEKKYEEANELFRKALEIFKSKLPPDHPDTKNIEQCIFVVEEATHAQEN